MSSWASRLILCPKYNPNTPKDQPPDGIRVAWAGVQVNERLHKTVPTYPDPTKEMYKAARHKYKFSADGLKQYWSIPLDPKTSEITAFWTHKGLYKFKRLVMGSKNAATVAQNAYTRALNTHLNPRSRNHIANFADDFCGGADTIAELLIVFEDFLEMCYEAGIMLKPSKVQFGLTQVQFYGYELGHNTIQPCEKNLDPRVPAPSGNSRKR